MMKDELLTLTFTETIHDQLGIISVSSRGLSYPLPPLIGGIDSFIHNHSPWCLTEQPLDNILQTPFLVYHLSQTGFLISICKRNQIIGK